MPNISELYIPDQPTIFNIYDFLNNLDSLKLPPHVVNNINNFMKELNYADNGMYLAEDIFDVISVMSDANTNGYIERIKKMGYMDPSSRYRYNGDDINSSKIDMGYGFFNKISTYFKVPEEVLLSILFVETEGFNRLAINTYDSKNRNIYDEGLGQLKHIYAVRYWVELRDKGILRRFGLEKQRYNPFNWKHNLIVQAYMLELVHRQVKDVSNERLSNTQLVTIQPLSF